MIGDLLALARARGVRIACAESCTGGMLAALLTEISGASDVFDRGFITYSNAAKIEMLGVSAASLQRFGAVSETVAAEMAMGARARSGAGLTIAITGIAGPGGSDFKPEGRVCFALVSGSELRVETVEFGAIGRGNVRLSARDHATLMLIAALRDDSPLD